MLVATVERLCRYPVKSMLGEDLREAEVSERGITGDRGWALLDAGTGRVVSAKHPRLWAGMLGFTAVTGPVTGPGARPAVLGPDGGLVGEGGLSERLGRKVRLVDVPPPGASVERSVPEEVLARGVRAEVGFTVSELGRGAPSGTFFDFAPLHLLTTAALAAADAPAAAAGRYRPNLVLRTPGGVSGFVENGWVEGELAVGPELRLHVLAATPRCAVPTLAHGPGLPRSAAALRVLAERNRVVPLPGMAALPCLGVYARVLRPGRVRVGDRVGPVS
ncbi:MOSC N-terminal beta barrel domain-containing protein [Kitasatospora purpeofusca]|uniref:MOSC N-terminal beta barrel domain-containing protein n=1 Tax=Kitasatospora purpeofusca TaxID=67352 RepID=UPI002A5A20FD|nr:MOSC N-terminal beta barrel domain-containing protein [Kitasatospora purpeofusca]MDY0811757.1 MOSC N-terminal beta barrel domain-containing protein [Kitasatospora purpeofusca]